MAGIYLHIPFCKQACHYCDFHFSINLKKKKALLEALKIEIGLRQQTWDAGPIETIYFGGGTPSLLNREEINDLLVTIRTHFEITTGAEITLETNPDDLSESILSQWAEVGVNRLSIGVQSLEDNHLKLMNRAHNAKEAATSIALAQAYFENLSIDLIYGIPGMDDAQWKNTVEKVLAYNIPHISSYALTVEPKTALQKFIAKGVVPDVDDEQAQRQFNQLVAILTAHGFMHYELSNFGLPGYFSQNNTAYWQGKPYLGIGPSAHSFDGIQRGWNIRNNSAYIKALEAGEVPITYETLSTTDRYNEYVMTGLRTIWGVSLLKVEQELGGSYAKYLKKQAQKYVDEHLLFWDDAVLLATKKGKFLVDGIASDLFMLNLR
ncbi:MAG: radical SAM family heme chaperone HemW [Bacteroidota bacterium]